MSQPDVSETEKSVGRPFVNWIWTSKSPSTNVNIAPAKSRRRAGVSL